MTSSNDALPDDLKSYQTELGELSENVQNYWEDSIKIFRKTVLHPDILGELQNKRRIEIILLLRETLENAIEALRDMCARHRDMHKIISHVGRTVSRCFPRCNDECILQRIIPNENQSLALDKMIAEGLFLNGHSDAADCLLKRLTDEDKDEILKTMEEFMILKDMAEKIRQNNISPVIAWVSAVKAEKYGPTNTVAFDIDYILAEAHFLSLIANSEYSDALAYARSTLYQLASKLSFEDRLVSIMGCLSHDRKCQFADSLQFTLPTTDKICPYGKHPYDFYFSRDYRQIVITELSAWLCNLRGKKLHGHLEKCLLFGRLSLPSLVKRIDELKALSLRSGTSITAAGQELPLLLHTEKQSEGRLERGIRKANADCFHSRFVCPILKVQSSPNNPPVRLQCGHVICKDALESIITSNHLKCPYCNLEQNPTETTEVMF